jgi:nitroreductase
MNVAEAISGRTSCRAFTHQPVAIESIERILQTAMWAPSGGNLQPWHVHVLAGERMRAFRALIGAKLLTQPMGEATEYNVYPPQLKEPYRSRRFKCGEDLYATIGIGRDNRMARLAQFAKNYDFFGAPVALFVSVDRHMGAPQWSDIGMFLQSVMLLLHEQGLSSCAQEAWAAWPRTVGDFIALPSERMLFCGVAIGYRDSQAPINQLRTERAPLAETVTIL